MALTFSAPCTKEWSQVVDGGQVSSVGIQRTGETVVFVAVATAQPVGAFQDYIDMTAGRSREIVLELEANEKLYVKGGDAIDVAIRGWKKVRAQ